MQHRLELRQAQPLPPPARVGGEDDATVVEPRLVGGRRERRQTLDVRRAVRARPPSSTDGQSSGWAKPGIRPGPGSYGASAVRPAAAAAAVPLDRPRDDGVALGVRGRDALAPSPAPARPSRAARPCGAPSRGSTSTVAATDLAAELREPRAVLGDEVEREAVAAGRDRRAHARLDGRALARRERRAAACARRPTRSGCRGRRASGRRGGSRRARRPCRRSRARPARGRPLPRAGRRASSRPSGRQAAPSPWAASLGRVEPLLVRAARREAVERTPVWFMRQAGRSLPEYREIRERHAFFEINQSAELTAEVTLQPVRRHGVDAAVMFADIMTPVVAMGLDVELVEGVGPVVREPVRSLAAVERLRVPDPEEAVAPVLEAIGIVRRELAPEQAVVGFCGGPFTVAGYLVEGQAVARVRGHEDADVRASRRSGTRCSTSSPTRSPRTPSRRRARAPTSCSSSTRGSARCRRPTTRSSSRRGRRGCSARCATPACRRSTSAPGRRRCCRRWPRPAAT